MKLNNKARFILFFLAAIFAFASCKQMLSPVIESKKASVSFKCEASDNMIARTIKPSVDLEDYTYKATARKGNGSETDLFSGLYSLADFQRQTAEIAPGVWTFTVTAYKDGEPVLTGSATQNISEGNNSIAITLRAASGSNGTAKVTLSFPSGKGVAKVTAGLYDTPIGNDSGNALQITEGTYDYDIENDDINMTPSSVTYEDTKVPTDTQQFVRFFLYDVNDICIGSYTEAIYAVKGLVSEKEAELEEINTFMAGVLLAKGDKPWTESRKKITLKKDNLEYELTNITEPVEYSYVYLGSVPLGLYDVYCDGVITGTEVEVEVDISEDDVGKVYYVDATKENVYSAITSVNFSTNNGEYYGPYFNTIVKITGAVTDDIIGTIRNALDNTKNHIVLDFSESTGLKSVDGWIMQWQDKIYGVIFPDGLKEIGASALISCSNLRFVSVPASVTEIGHSAFSGISNIKEIHIDENNKNYKVHEKLTVLSKDGKTLVSASNLTGNIEVPYGVEEIQDNAFNEATWVDDRKITSVKLPETVKSIGNGAFSGCNRLRTINIPASVTELGTTVFNSCTSLTNIVVATGNTVYSSSSNGQMILSKEGTKLYYYPSAPSNLIIPGDITEIADTAFYGSSTLESVFIPKSVTKIGRSAFAATSTTFEVASENERFATAKEGSVLISKDEKTIVSWPSASEAEVWEGVETLGPGSFAGGRIMTLTLPSTIKKLETDALEGQWSNNLSLIIKATTPPEVDRKNINGTCNVKRIYVPETALATYKAQWGDWEWTGNGSKIYTIHDHNWEQTGEVYDWGNSNEHYHYVYEVCTICNETRTTSTWEEHSVEEYDEYEYVNENYHTHKIGAICTKCNYGYNAYSESSHTWVETVSTEETVSYECLCGATKTLEKDALTFTWTDIDDFDSESLSSNTLYTISITGVYDDTKQSDLRAKLQSSSKTVILDLSGTTKPDASENFSFDGKAFSNCSSLVSVVLPDGVTAVGNYAFYNCTNLTEITLPSSVTYIGDYAFGECNKLTEITLPSSVTYIGGCAFGECNKLTEITIPSSVTYIDAYAFSYCQNLVSVTFDNPADWFLYGYDTPLDLSSPPQNATYLKETYISYLWYRNE